MLLRPLAVSASLLLAACSAGAPPEPDSRWTVAAETASVEVDHRPWDAFLAEYVRDDGTGLTRVAYGRVTEADKAALRSYLDDLQRAPVERLTRDQQMAYWFNLYNAATVDLILDNYPVESIRNIGVPIKGPWDQKILEVGGEKLSLNDVEHRILRPIFKDVRIHYAVNCASVGCPNLAVQAYTAERLEAMLEDAARAYVNSPRGFAEIDGRLVASSIYDWYESDWGDVADVLEHARGYAEGETARMLAEADAIDGYRYDWSLNDAR
jgi:hypothetical protein